MDRAGVGVARAKVWAIGGDWRRPETVATATTDDRGYFVFPRAWEPAGPQPSRFLNVFARVGDGRIGWRSSIWWNHTHEGKLTIVLGPIGQIRGRLNDRRAGRSPGRRSCRLTSAVRRRNTPAKTPSCSAPSWPGRSGPRPPRMARSRSTASPGMPGRRDDRRPWVRQALDLLGCIPARSDRPRRPPRSGRRPAETAWKVTRDPSGKLSVALASNFPARIAIQRHSRCITSRP